jgi:hypothetical protein
LVRLAGSGTGIRAALERRWRELEKKHYDCSRIMMSKKKSSVSGLDTIKAETNIFKIFVEENDYVC